MTKTTLRLGRSALPRLKALQRPQRSKTEAGRANVDWTLLVVLLSSIIALTALVTITVRRIFIGSITIAVAAAVLGIFAGISGASHGPGEILQGDIAPSGIIIEAWPSLTLLGGAPAMTLFPTSAYPE